MKTLAEQVAAYEAYHQDFRNRMTHFVGVPLVTFAIFLFLGWLRFVHDPALPFTGATLFYLSVILYYLKLDWKIALLQAPLTVSLLILANWIAVWPFTQSLTVFLTTFVGGWIIQLIGHAMEGRRPALADNILQIFNAPLFLTVEVIEMIGPKRSKPGSQTGESTPFLAK